MASSLAEVWNNATGAKASSAWSEGAAAGAAIGSVVPGIGTVIGGAIGGMIGWATALGDAAGTTAIQDRLANKYRAYQVDIEPHAAIDSLDFDQYTDAVVTTRPILFATLTYALMIGWPDEEPAGTVDLLVAWYQRARGISDQRAKWLREGTTFRVNRIGQYLAVRLWAWLPQQNRRDIEAACKRDLRNPRHLFTWDFCGGKCCALRDAGITGWAPVDPCGEWSAVIPRGVKILIPGEVGEQFRAMKGTMHAPAAPIHLAPGSAGLRPPSAINVKKTSESGLPWWLLLGGAGAALAFMLRKK